MYIIFFLLKKAVKYVTVLKVLGSPVSGTLTGERQGLAKLYLKGLRWGESSHTQGEHSHPPEHV